MGISSPLPSSLPKECAKAAQIFRSFVSIIPQDLLRNAKGFAILTIAKAGFLFSARAGAGVVIVKLPNGSWSAPSAIGTGGLGVGGQAGAELSEFVIILNSRAAVQSFMSSGSINIGGNLSVAVGPLGRNAEATGSLNKLAAMYSYSRTKGLFGGASLEGGVIFERKDANEKAYVGFLDDSDIREVSARRILSGQVETPPWASGLISTIERGVGSKFDETWVDDQPSDLEERLERGYSFTSDAAAQGSGRSRGDESPTYESKSGKNRLRGYSLGSFGRQKSFQEKRNRSLTTSNVPDYKWQSDQEEDEFGNRGFKSSFRDRNGSGRKTRDRDAGEPREDEDYYVPPSPSSTTSSRSQRFTEFMKRPVLPARKSTSSAAEMRGGGSPLAGRSRSNSKAFSSPMKQGRSRFDDDDGYGRVDQQDSVFDLGDEYRASRRRDEDDGPASPFDDQFSGKFGQNFDFSKYSNNDANRSRSPSPVSQKRPEPKSKSSFLGNAASVLARPLSKRSSTAPIPQRQKFREDDSDEEPSYPRQSVGHPGRGPSPVRFRDDSSDTGSELIPVDSNPFEDDNTAGPSKPGGVFFSSKNSRDLLSTLDEEPGMQASSYSSMEQPRHRLDAYAADDSHSIRSIDSDKEFTFGNKVHKIALVTNTLDGRDASVSGARGDEEYRVAHYDFVGGESGDLPFKTGDVIEVISKDSPDWWQGSLRGKRGIFPVNRTGIFTSDA